MHRTALVTGAARGIGYEVAKTLATNGVNVVLADLKQEEVERAAESFTRSCRSGGSCPLKKSPIMFSFWQANKRKVSPGRRS
ncbi:hypothetical protein B4113_2192 [Geobacillus sp. B4113_201601]|nr:hypothetical protein B4113_2192 [Geobacillus sp. B4113_201601]